MILEKDIQFLELPMLMKTFHQHLPIEVGFVMAPFEDDFIETGMRGYLVGAEESKHDTIIVYFYFGDHVTHNTKMMRRTYYDSNNKPKLTAIESGHYENHYSVHCNPEDYVENYFDQIFM